MLWNRHVMPNQFSSRCGTTAQTWNGNIIASIGRYSTKEYNLNTMDLKNVQRIELPATADMHVHLRQGDMMELVAPTLTAGGVDTAFV